MPSAEVLLSNIGNQVELLSAETDFNLSLGSSDSTTNNSLNLMAKVKAIALAIEATQKNQSQSEVAHQALRMATINGAKTLGWDNQIGSIESGKFADFNCLRNRFY